MGAMLKRVKAKLRDNGGVTLLMALFALLVASMVCVVILSASVTSVKQAKDSQQQEQDTLMLQSAAKLVAEDFADAKVERVVTEIVSSGTSIFSAPTYAASNCMIPTSFATVAGQAIDRGTVAETAPSSGSFTVTVTLPEGYQSKLDVKRQVKVSYIVRNASYNAADQVGMNNQIVFTFALMPNDEFGKAVQRLYLKMSCNVGAANRTQVSDSQSGETVYKIVTEYTWKNPVFYTSEGVG